MIKISSTKKKERKKYLKSIEETYLEELKEAKNICIFYRKNCLKILTNVCGEEIFYKMIHHCRSCRNCKKNIHICIEKIWSANNDLEIDLKIENNIDCSIFTKNNDFYVKKMFSEKLSAMLQTHCFTCNRCNDVYINNMKEYKEKFNVSDRVC